jgi:hypothetical protein
LNKNTNSKNEIPLPGEIIPIEPNFNKISIELLKAVN